MVSPTIKRGDLVLGTLDVGFGVGSGGESHLVLEENMPTYDEIFGKVQATLVDALGVDEDEVTRAATLQGDLGAESSDFLDIVFRLERNFAIKIPRGELFPENLMADPEWVAEGKLTAKGVDELKSRLPFADLTKLEENPALDKIGDLYTVDMLVQYVQSKLAA
jgi:acyl carrier protein